MAESAARQRINWRVLGVEAAAIFLSVLLGFGVTEWREARHDAWTVDQALDAYAREVAENQSNVARGYAYHGPLNAALQRRAGPPAPGATLFDVLGEAGFRGPQQITFQTAARATAEATDVLGLLPFDTASSLVALYEAQDELDEVEAGLATAAFNPAILDAANVDAALLSMTAYFSMVSEAEAQLLWHYRNVIETLGIEETVAADSLLAP